MTSRVPVVDMSALAGTDDGDAASTVVEIDAACVATGFFIVTGHGLDDDLDAVFAAARDLFALPMAAKRALSMRDRCGYVDDGAKEMFDVALTGGVASTTNRWPAVASFRPVVTRYQASALAVAAILLEALATALGVERTFFAQRMRHPECFLRLLRYPSGSTGETTTRAHSDYGAITLLATDGVAGLQVHPIGGPWIDVVAPAGSIIVNLGDMLARWTNDHYVSTPHRVVASSNVERYSVPFFVNPDADTVVECIASCAGPDRPARYDPVTATEFLHGRIDGTIAVPMP